MKALVTTAMVLLLAVPSIVQADWVELDAVGGPDEEADVEQGGCCTRTRGYVFVTVGGYSQDIYAYNLATELWLQDEDAIPDMPGFITNFGAMCSEAPDGARIFVASDDSPGNLYVYTFDKATGAAGSWTDPEETPMGLPEVPVDGACLAFDPLDDPASVVAGHLYYIPGDSKRMWRRAFDKIDLSPDGLFPGDGGQVEDGGVVDLKAVRGVSAYELQVSTSPDFGTRVYTASSAHGELRLPRGRLPLNRQLWYRARFVRGSRAGDWSMPRGFTVASSGFAPARAFPPDGARIASPKPVLDWVDRSEAVRYRVQMSSAPDFSRMLVDEVVPTGEYVSPDLVQPGTYFWRTAWQSESGAWSDWGATAAFTDDWQWASCDSKPDGVSFLGGAAMVYASNGSPAKESLYVMVGNGSYEFWCYSLNGAQPRWQQLASTPFQQFAGASLAPHLSQTRLRATEGSNPYGVMRQYVTDDDVWSDVSDSELPRECAGGSGITYGDGAPLTLVISDEFEETNFYKWVTDEGDGLQTASLIPAAQPTLSARLANGVVRVKLVVPAAGRVALSLIDAVGRRVGGCDVGVLGAGQHEFTLGDPHGAVRIARGAYLVRAEVNGAAAVAKAVVF
jgi:hypothetical protein